MALITQKKKREERCQPALCSVLRSSCEGESPLGEGGSFSSLPLLKINTKNQNYLCGLRGEIKCAILRLFGLSITPRSVIIAVIFPAGVTSKAGL